MRGTVFAATLAGLALAGPAFAGPETPVAVPIYPWSGWYGGIHGGYGWGDGNASGIVDPGTVPLSPGWVVTAPVPAAFAIADPDPKGWIFGAQIGVNQQAGRTVYGVEADFTWSGIRGSSAVPISLAINDPDQGAFAGQASLESKLEWFGTLRGRLGYTFERFLPYVTGGLAYGNLKTTLTVGGSTFDTGGGVVLVGSNAVSASASATQVGFAVGAGVDWAVVDRWTLRAEYLFLSFPDRGITLVVPGGSAASSGLDVHLARAALNYRF
ncbi:MAG TPA: outer membrane beta-barrel protein [Xanthobacteraceae bacterium]|jgi:outer membrane immunogenic protein|nr:outer membrane beta-barrel protein [Xanthobacteraceae bacterium]